MWRTCDDTAQLKRSGRPPPLRPRSKGSATHEQWKKSRKRETRIIIPSALGTLAYADPGINYCSTKAEGKGGGGGGGGGREPKLKGRGGGGEKI